MIVGGKDCLSNVKDTPGISKSFLRLWQLPKDKFNKRVDIAIDRAGFVEKRALFLP